MKTKLINKINIPEYSVKKWKPVLDSANISSDDDDYLKIICNIIENHAIMESTNHHYVTGVTLAPINDYGLNNTNLPTVLKISAQLNLSDKNVLITNSPMNNILMNNGEIKNVRIGEITSTFKTTRSYIEDLGDIMLETINKKLSDDIVKQINYKLKYYDTIIIYNLFNVLSTTAESTMSPVFFANSRIEFLDRNDIKEPMYNKTEEKGKIVKVEISENGAYTRQEMEIILNNEQLEKDIRDNNIKLIEDALI